MTHAPRGHLRTRILPIPLTLLTTCALATACGSSAGTPSPPPVTTPTIAPASDADLQRVHGAAGLALAKSAKVDLELVASQVFGSATAPVTGAGVFDFARAQGQAQLQQPAGTETVVFLPASVFVRQPTGPNVLPPGRTWISAGLTEAALTTNFPQFVIQTEALNPVFLLDETAWGAVTAAPLGATTVNGVHTHGYLVMVDLARAASAATGPASAAFAKAIGFQLNALGSGSPAASTTITVRVWVDDAMGTVVRMQSSPPGAGAGTVITTLHDYGTSVHVAPPPSSKVADIASLSPGGERENNGGGDSDGA
jgi:hypothetical protein